MKYIIDKRLNFRKKVDYIRHKTDRKMNLFKVLNSLSAVNASILKNIYTSTIQSTLEYGAVTFGSMAPSIIDRLQVSQNQGMRLILGVPRCTGATQTSDVTRGTQNKALPEDYGKHKTSSTCYNQQETTKWMDH